MDDFGLNLLYQAPKCPQFRKGRPLWRESIHWNVESFNIAIVFVATINVPNNHRRAILGMIQTGKKIIELPFQSTYTELPDNVKDSTSSLFSLDSITLHRTL